MVLFRFGQERQGVILVVTPSWILLSTMPNELRRQVKRREASLAQTSGYVLLTHGK